MSCVTILVTTDPHLSLAPSYSARSSQEQPGAPRSSQEQPGAARSSQEHPRSPQEQPGARSQRP